MNVKERDSVPNVIVFTRQSYTAFQKDLFTLAVSQLDKGFNVQPDLWQNKTVTVSVKMLGEITGKNYDRIKRECKAMAQKQIEISNDEEEEFEFIQPFPRIKYRKGVIEMTMFADVIPHFLELRNGYSDVYIRESLGLEHFNKKRLYELLSAYKNRNISIWEDVSDTELKGYLGMKETEYRGRPSQFEKQIISVCVNAINEKTSINVTYTRHKDGGEWFTTFTVKDKKPAQKSKFVEFKGWFDGLDEKGQRLAKRLEALKVRPDMLRKVVDEHQTDAFRWLNAPHNIEDMKNGKIRNPAAVLLVHLGLLEPKM